MVGEFNRGSPTRTSQRDVRTDVPPRLITLSKSDAAERSAGSFRPPPLAGGHAEVVADHSRCGGRLRHITSLGTELGKCAAPHFRRERAGSSRPPRRAGSSCEGWWAAGCSSHLRSGFWAGWAAARGLGPWPTQPARAATLPWGPQPEGHARAPPRAAAAAPPCLRRRDTNRAARAQHVGMADVVQPSPAAPVDGSRPLPSSTSARSRRQGSETRMPVTASSPISASQLTARSGGRIDRAASSPATATACAATATPSQPSDPPSPAARQVGNSPDHTSGIPVILERCAGLHWADAEVRDVRADSCGPRPCA
jgi:hypothetical protein